MAVTGILGKKIGMTQVFDEKGEVHPITVLQAGPCVITQLKTLAKDGYEAAQIGLVEFIKTQERDQAAWPGTSRKTEAPPVKLMREVLRSADVGSRVPKAKLECNLKAGDRVLVDIFPEDKYVDVIGTQQGPRFRWRRAASPFWRRTEGARTHVPGAGLDRCIAVPVARVSRAAHAWPHGRGPGDGAQSAHSRH